jgi:hypothetical protein
MPQMSSKARVGRHVTMGKTVKRNITHSRMDWDVNMDSDACRSSPPLDRTRCRWISHTTKIPHTKRIGNTVVATRRLWKLLSTTQFRGRTEMSTDKILKKPQKDLKDPGKSVRT